MKAKVVSLVGKIITAGGLVVCAILKWRGTLPNATIQEIVAVAVAGYGILAGTIDLNIMLDKFTGGKNA